MTSVLPYYITTRNPEGDDVLVPDWELRDHLAFPDEKIRSVPYNYADPASVHVVSRGVASFLVLRGSCFPVHEVLVWNGTVPEFMAERALVGIVNIADLMATIEDIHWRMRGLRSKYGPDIEKSAAAAEMASLSDLERDNGVIPVCERIDALIKEYESGGSSDKGGAS